MVSLKEKKNSTKSNAEQGEAVLDSDLVIEVSKDEMTAVAKLIPPKGGQLITFGQALKKIEEKGITYGTDLAKLREIIEKNVFLTNFEVAKGLPQVNGRDGKVIIHFETKKSLKPRLSESGKVDFYNLDMVINVSKGQLLAEIIFPTEGKPGMTVTGKTVMPKKGKMARIIPAKNVSISDDGTRITADIDGQPVLSNGKLSVLPILEIKGDVGPATGNINFLGSVFVRGNVKDGYKVTAEGDIEIVGTVESAEIVSNGSIKLVRGIQGRGKGRLKAGLDVIARYIENTQVEAENNIVSEAAMHSTLFAGNKIILKGRRGLIVGGKSTAGEEVVAKTIGSQLATYTEIEVGVNPKHKKALQEINLELTNTKKNLTKVRQTIDTLHKLKDRNLMTTDKQSLYNKLLNTREALEMGIDQLNKEKERLEMSISKPSRAKVSASDIVFTGVNIIINNSSLKLRDKVEHVTFYNYEGQIKFGPYEG